MATTLWTLKEMRESLLRRKAKLEAGRYETAHGAQFASKADAARLLGVSTDTITRMQIERRLQPVQLTKGGRPRFRIQDLHKLMKGGQQ